MTDDLEDLLDLLDEARVEDRFSELNVTEMARTLRHILGASLALELPIDGTEKRVVQTTVARLGSRLIHSLRINNVGDTHVLDLLRREESKLDLLNRLERRTRVREV